MDCLKGTSLSEWRAVIGNRFTLVALTERLDTGFLLVCRGPLQPVNSKFYSMFYCQICGITDIIEIF